MLAATVTATDDDADAAATDDDDNDAAAATGRSIPSSMLVTIDYDLRARWQIFGLICQQAYYTEYIDQRGPALVYQQTIDI